MGYTNEKITIFLASDLQKTKRHLDETEDIKVIEISMKKLNNYEISWSKYEKIKRNVRQK